MARANARTLGLLNRWPEVMWAIPYRFNQITGEKVVAVPNCQNAVYIQQERDYIARELQTAIQRFAEYLGYFPAPKWIEDEVIPLDCDLSWNGQTLTTRYGHVIEFGRRATSLIDDDVTVTYSDADSDGLQDTATIVVTTTVAAEEIKLFFRVGDGAKGAAAEFWEIEPVTVTKVGTTATITAPRHLFVHPTNVWAKQYSGSSTQNLFAGEAANAAHFVTLVDVYRVYADPTNAVELLSPAEGLAAGANVVAATGDIDNSYYGNFAVYTGSAQSSPAASPHSVRVSYRAGLALDETGQMDGEFAMAIIRYANLLFPQQPAMCDRTLAMWNEDRKNAELTAFDAWHPPPFGITNAGMNAWQVVEARHIPLKGKATDALMARQ